MRGHTFVLKSEIAAVADVGIVRGARRNFQINIKLFRTRAKHLFFIHINIYALKIQWKGKGGQVMSGLDCSDETHFSYGKHVQKKKKKRFPVHRHCAVINKSHFYKTKYVTPITYSFTSASIPTYTYLYMNNVYK